MKIDTTGKELMFVTVRISAELPGGTSFGTGFIMNLTDRKDEYIPVLVTNKHVVARASKITAHFVSRKDGLNEPDFGKGIDLVINPVTDPFIGHPDPQIDVCAIALVPLLGEDQSKVFTRSINPSLVPDDAAAEQLDAVEEVTFIGCPNGWYDTYNKTPIIRKGITATPLALKYGGAPVFLVDGSVFGGSSGSPVFIFNEGSYRQGNDLYVGNRLLLVGILAQTMVRHSGFPVDVRTAPHVKVAQELNLGVAFDRNAILQTLGAVATHHRVAR